MLGIFTAFARFGQGEYHVAVFALGALGANRAAVERYYRFYYEKSQAYALFVEAAALVGLIKTLENMRQFV